MSLNATPSAQRLHIGFFGLRNAGKSSLVNAVTGQSLSLVSDVKGTTTDPVKKAIELLPLGPVVIVDTPGLDDEGELGQMRVQRAKQMLAATDVAVLVTAANNPLSPLEENLLKELEERKLPHILARNKADLLDAVPACAENEIFVSALTGFGIPELKEKLAALAPKQEKKILSDLVSPADTVVLVCPIDESAPKGRLILPQQLVVRELLDIHASAVVCQPEELAGIMNTFGSKVKLVITDSQVFGKVARDVPKEVPLTSFSILMARYKGDLATVIRGAAMLNKLQDGDKILISEGCTHHRQCKDIGTVKLPGWIKNYCQKDVEFTFTSGGDFPEDLSDFALIVHCGGCMLNEGEMKSRLARSKAQSVPMTNYGIAIAQIHGILRRSVEPFPAIAEILG